MRQPGRGADKENAPSVVASPQECRQLAIVPEKFAASKAGSVACSEAERPLRSKRQRTETQSSTVYDTAQAPLDLATLPQFIKELEGERDLAKEKHAREEQSHKDALRKQQELTKKVTTLQRELDEERAKPKQATSDALISTSSGSTVDARVQKLVNEKRNLALEVQGLKEARDSAEARCKSLASTLERLQKEDGGGHDRAQKTRGTTAASSSQASELAARIKALEAEVKERDARLAEATKTNKKVCACAHEGLCMRD